MRDDICGRKKILSGPVLFTDFRGVESSSDAKARVMETIQPLFLPSFSPLFDERGNLAQFLLSTSVLFLLSSSLIYCLLSR